MGLAAKRDIPQGTELCFYVGIVYDDVHNPDSNHCIEMGRSGATLLYINASQIPFGLLLGRCMHLANHSCDPNCVVTYYVPDGWDNDLVLFILVAARDIVIDEDVTFQYKGSTICNIAPHTAGWLPGDQVWLQESLSQQSRTIGLDRDTSPCAHSGA